MNIQQLQNKWYLVRTAITTHKTVKSTTRSFWGYRRGSHPVERRERSSFKGKNLRSPLPAIAERYSLESTVPYIISLSRQVPCGTLFAGKINQCQKKLCTTSYTVEFIVLLRHILHAASRRQPSEERPCHACTVVGRTKRKCLIQTSRV